ncbi:MAG: catalase [Leptospiraceae bacterium]|nr:catalase [Leptospiraceae bacterium]MCP5511751.1 catalase [Leptospiraceae bacterium]
MDEMLVIRSDVLNSVSDLNRERIPERVTHAKGVGAYGEFISNGKGRDFCSAPIFNKLKKVPIFVRFSNYRGEKGSPDSIRDPRGMAIKFYTETGNWDLAANNLPVFFVKDPKLIVDFIHSQKRNPTSNLFDPNQKWDFFSRYPESLHAVLMSHSERGLPYSFRFMNAYSCHSFLWINEEGSKFIVKLHVKSLQGVKNLSDASGAVLAGRDPDFYQTDMFESIKAGEYPAWDLAIQAIPFKDLNSLSVSPFDVTLTISQKDYPLISIGKIELNSNVTDYFSEVEESAFQPAALLKGMYLTPDPILHSRVYAYSDASRYRLGVNYKEIPVNRSFVGSQTNRDGMMQMGNREHFNRKNLYSGQEGVSDLDWSDLPGYPYDPFSQPAEFLSVIGEEGRELLLSTLIYELKDLRVDIQTRFLNQLNQVNPEFSNRLKIEISKKLPEGVDVKEKHEIYLTRDELGETVCI